MLLAKTFKCLGALFTLQILSLTILSASTAWGSEREVLCQKPGEWLLPNGTYGSRTSHSTVFEDLEDTDFVLLGEQHDQVQHHRWQTQMLSALLAHENQITIGLEMLPKSSQPALDAWVAGQISLTEFLGQAAWYDTWRFDVELYMPLLNFARENRVPLYALNIPRDVISKISESGWDTGMAANARPAPAKSGYRSMLQEVFQHHAGSDKKQLEFFIQAQLMWDKAFAEGLQTAKKETSRLVVGIIGSGHLTYGYGVKHQLNSIGNYDVLTWIPTNTGSACTSLNLINEDGDSIADAIFVTSTNAGSEKKHKLGLFLLDGEDGIVVGEVLEDSIASQSGFEVNDVIVEAAGQAVSTSGEFIAIIQDQTPGYWLPITINRDDKLKELVAEIPPRR